MSKEREQILDESRVGEATVPPPANINTKAYMNVKNKWVKRGIWNDKWGILPGMSWKHEETFKEETADDPAPVQANTLEDGSYAAEEAPRIIAKRLA